MNETRGSIYLSFLFFFLFFVFLLYFLLSLIHPWLKIMEGLKGGSIVFVTHIGGALQPP
jgi:hypothetical protein